MPNDRRKEPRCLIDAPLFCTVRTLAGNSIICIINDISLNGAMLIVPPDDLKLLSEEQQLTFIEVPEQFESTLINMTATLAWRKDKVCGLQFTTHLPLTEDGLIAIVASIENTMGTTLNLDDDVFTMDFDDDDRF